MLATLASAVGDRETLEAVLAGAGAAYFHPEEVELFRATTERAAGDAEAGTRRLRELEAPPAGLVAATAAKRLEHPTPAFDERHLAGAAGRGLERYRRLAARARRS